jgi:hypothetical protein
MHVERNNVNVFPHSTFNWVGIDGTQVLCHMTPVGTFPRSIPELQAVHQRLHQIHTTHRQPQVIFTRRSPITRSFTSLVFYLNDL